MERRNSLCYVICNFSDIWGPRVLSVLNENSPLFSTKKLDSRIFKFIAKNSLSPDLVTSKSRSEDFDVTLQILRSDDVFFLSRPFISKENIYSVSAVFPIAYLERYRSQFIQIEASLTACAENLCETFTGDLDDREKSIKREAIIDAVDREIEKYVNQVGVPYEVLIDNYTMHINNYDIRFLLKAVDVFLVYRSVILLSQNLRVINEFTSFLAMYVRKDVRESSLVLFNDEFQGPGTAVFYPHRPINAVQTNKDFDWTEYVKHNVERIFRGTHPPGIVDIDKRSVRRLCDRSWFDYIKYSKLLPLSEFIPFLSLQKVEDSDVAPQIVSLTRAIETAILGKVPNGIVLEMLDNWLAMLERKAKSVIEIVAAMKDQSALKAKLDNIRGLVALKDEGLWKYVVGIICELSPTLGRVISKKELCEIDSMGMLGFPVGLEMI